MKIYCQICTELIATAEPTSLGIPLTGSMFGPPFPGMGQPILLHTDWEHLRCPMCHNRPFLRNDEVLTDGGIYKIPVDKDIAFPCPPVKGIAGYIGNSGKKIILPLNYSNKKHSTKYKYVCDCCDPPRKFDSLKKLNGHKGAMKRWGNK